MSPLIVQLILVAVGGGIGYLVKHLQAPAAPSPTPAPAVNDPFAGLPGLSGHPILNSPILKTVLQEIEAQVLASLQAQVKTVVNLQAPSVTPKA